MCPVAAKYVSMRITLPPQSEHMVERLVAITDVIRELVSDDLAMLILFGSYGARRRRQ